MYDHKKQYKCMIIRARAISEADDLLPQYATIIDYICPCSKDEFKKGFDNAFRKYAESKASDKSNKNAIQKTLNNHRTEVSGSLFGMHYESDNIVYASERTKKFLQDNDQPAFFKDWLFKMQFPNGMQKSQTYLHYIGDGVHIRPYHFMLKVLQFAKRENIVLLKQEIGYYILNSEDVLKGNANPNEVIDQIVKDKKMMIEPRKIKIPADASTSYDQHISDQLKYLELANLIIIHRQEVHLNPNEEEALQLFADQWNAPLEFDVYSYDLSTVKNRKDFEAEWAKYYSELSPCVNKFVTTTKSLGITDKNTKDTTGKHMGNTVEFGDEGELYVLEYEKNRVRSFDSRLVLKVKHLGKTKGLGYDIQSVIAEDGDMSEFVKYIEVKSTKRVTAPKLSDTMWVDTLNITRNEWVAALQHKDFYSIFRVYFVRGNIIIYIINNLYQKERDRKVKVVPMTYRVDFDSTAIDVSIINKERVG